MAHLHEAEEDGDGAHWFDVGGDVLGQGAREAGQRVARVVHVRGDPAGAVGARHSVAAALDVRLVDDVEGARVDGLAAGAEVVERAREREEHARGRELHDHDDDQEGRVDAKDVAAADFRVKHGACKADYGDDHEKDADHDERHEAASRKSYTAAKLMVHLIG